MKSASVQALECQLSSALLASEARQAAEAGVQATRVVKKIAPGDPGAIKLSRQYGDALVCVRYRHDAQGLRRYTTVEVVIECVPVQPRKPSGSAIVDLKLPPFDRTLRSVVLASGGQWDGREKVWRLPRKIAEQLGLLDHEVKK